jgi:ankyrin repeat protein
MTTPVATSLTYQDARSHSGGGGCSHHLGVFDDYLEHCHRSCSNLKDSDQLLFCVQQNNLEAVEKLVLEGGVSPVYSNPMKQSALHIAARYGHVECLQFLLQQIQKNGNIAGVINAQNRLCGATPLHCCLQKTTNTEAEASRHMACVHLLMQAGARIDVPDAEGKTPLDFWREQDARDESLSLTSLSLLNGSNQVAV